MSEEGSYGYEWGGTDYEGQMKYIITRKSHSKYGGIYEGNAFGLVGWYYHNLMVEVSTERPTQTLIIEIDGDFHTTYPNDPHLSVVFIYDGQRSRVYHMSINPRGNFYAQILPGRAGKKHKRTQKIKRKNKRYT